MNYDNSSKLGSDLIAKIRKLAASQEQIYLRQAQQADNQLQIEYNRGAYTALKYLQLQIVDLVEKEAQS